MKIIRNSLIALVGGVLAFVLAVAPTAQADTTTGQAPAAAVAWDAKTGEALAAWDCNLGNVCFWTGFGGTGSRCQWDIADPDWTSGAYVCSWATTRVVKSIYNRGQSSSLTGVVYYRNTGYNDRIGCTRQGKKGDLAGTYQLRSHRWTDGSCG